MHGFRFYFTPLKGVLFIFHSRYWCAIGHHKVLSLGGWAPRIHAGFHVAGATWENTEESICFRLQDCHLLWWDFPNPLANKCFFYSLLSRNPAWCLPLPHMHNACGLSHAHGLGLFPFARRYSGSRDFFPFLKVLRCFSSLGSPPSPMHSAPDAGV